MLHHYLVNAINPIIIRILDVKLPIVIFSKTNFGKLKSFLIHI